MYYAHNDSSEKALNLFAKCVKYSRQQGDTLTYCLGLFQSSRLLRLYDADRAIGYARQVVDIYNKVNVSTANRVYSLLNLAECLTYKENTLEEVIGFTQKAISLAQTIRTDQAPLADAYQDLSVFYSMYGEKPMCCKRQKRLTTYVRPTMFRPIWPWRKPIAKPTR